MYENITLAEVLETTFKTLTEDLHTCMPGVVETYDYKTETATIKPLLKKALLNDTFEELPILVNVPIKFQRSTIAGLTFGLNRGDGVLIIFSERSLEKWKSIGTLTEPGDPRRFDLSDGIALPGLFSRAQTTLSKNNDDVSIHNNGQIITIKKNGNIELGADTLLKLVNANFQSIFNNHGHDYVSPSGPAISGTPVAGITPTTIPTPITDNELTVEVKAK